MSDNNCSQKLQNDCCSAQPQNCCSEKSTDSSCCDEQPQSSCCTPQTLTQSSCCTEQPQSSCCSAPQSDDKYAESKMISECLEYAKSAKEAGRPIIGIMCEYAPREIINACGGVAICLCGGSQKTVESAEVDLSAGICPLIKSTYGYFLEKSNPFLEMADLLVAETTCDGKKKVFEIMGKEKECYTLELPQLSDAAASKEAWLNQCKSFASFLQERFSCEITDDKLRGAIRDFNKERQLRLDLAYLMTRKQPPLTGRELLGHNSIISPLPWAIERYEQSLTKYQGMTECSGHKDRKRVLLTGVPVVHGAERILELIESVGGIVVAQENCTGIKPLTPLVDPDAADPMVAIAEKYFSLPCSVMTPNAGREELLRKLVKDFSPDCIIDLSWQGCHTYDIESLMIREFSKAQGLPFLKIQTDYSTADTGQLTTRIQALLEIC